MKCGKHLYSPQIGTYAGDYDTVEGLLELPTFVNDANLAHKFYVMKPSKMIPPVLLGQTWQRKYSCKLDWRKEGIIYANEDREVLEPFLGEEHNDKTPPKPLPQTHPTMRSLFRSSQNCQLQPPHIKR